MRKWRAVPLPLLGGGEQSAAAPQHYQPGEQPLLRNALITGPGTVAQHPDWLKGSRLEATGAATDDLVEGGSVNLDAHTPDTGFTAWEYPGSSGDLLIEASAGLAAQTGGEHYARGDTDLADDGIIASVHVFRPSVDGTGQAGGLYLLADSTVAAALIVGEGVFVGFRRFDASNMQVVIERRDSAGVVQQRTNGASIAFALSSGKFIIAVLDGLTVTAYTAPSGTDPTDTDNWSALQATLTLNTDLRDGDHRRAGIVTTRDAFSQRMFIAGLTITWAAPVHAVVGIFPFEQQGGASAPSAGVLFGYNVVVDVVSLHQQGEDLGILRTLTALSSYARTVPPQVTAFEMYGKLYFVLYAREAATNRPGMGVFDPASGGTVLFPTYDLNAGAAAASVLKFRGICKHRGGTILGWGYHNEDDIDQPHMLRWSKYLAPDTWVLDSDETSAGKAEIGTVSVPIIACAQSGQYTVIGKKAEIFVLDGDYASQFYVRQIGNAHGPVSTAGMCSIGDAAVWMASTGPTISNQGGRPELLGVDRLTRRFLSYMDLTSCQAVHDSERTRVVFGMRRRYDDDGVPVSDEYLTDLLCWDYQRNLFSVLTPPAQFWAVGVTRGPGVDLAGPTGVVSALAASNVTVDSARITWTPGDDSPDVSFNVQWRPNGETTWRPSPALDTGQATYYRDLTGLPSDGSGVAIDVRVRQVKNGQVSDWTEAAALFTTLAQGSVASPTGVTVEELRWEVVGAVKFYGYGTVKWDGYLGNGLVMAVYRNTANNSATATRIGTAPAHVGQYEDPNAKIAGEAWYYWVRMETNDGGTTSSFVQATPAPITYVGVEGGGA